MQVASNSTIKLCFLVGCTSSVQNASSATEPAKTKPSCPVGCPSYAGRFQEARLEVIYTPPTRSVLGISRLRAIGAPKNASPQAIHKLLVRGNSFTAPSLLGRPDYGKGRATGEPTSVPPDYCFFPQGPRHPSTPTVPSQNHPLSCVLALPNHIDGRHINTAYFSYFVRSAPPGRAYKILYCLYKIQRES